MQVGFIGSGNIMWSTNFPQATSMWPESRAQIVLQYPALRTRTFSLLEMTTLLDNALQVRRRQAIGRGERLEAKLRLVVPAAAARQRAVPAPADERQWDLFDPYAYSLDIYEKVGGFGLGPS